MEGNAPRRVIGGLLLDPDEEAITKPCRKVPVRIRGVGEDTGVVDGQGEAVGMDLLAGV